LSISTNSVPLLRQILKAKADSSNVWVFVFTPLN